MRHHAKIREAFERYEAASHDYDNTRAVRNMGEPLPAHMIEASRAKYTAARMALLDAIAALGESEKGKKK